MAESIKITIRNDHTDEVIKKMKEALYDSFDLIGQRAVRNAVTNIENDPHRVDTGLLRNSITYAHGGEGPEKTSYKGSQESKYGKKGIPSGSYSGTAPKEGDESVYIGTNVEYALYVHEGTRKMAANRFLRDAIKGHEDEYGAICKNKFGQIS